MITINTKGGGVKRCDGKTRRKTADKRFGRINESTYDTLYLLSQSETAHLISSIDLCIIQDSRFLLLPRPGSHSSFSRFSSAMHFAGFVVIDTLGVAS